ncbi:MAG: mechanosensitive ion channel [Bacteriovoracaceae bacterium]|nr:mechanosensitive ion channel [Bacteriovoracaceae bacterium]
MKESFYKSSILPIIIEKLPLLLGTIFIFFVGWILINITVNILKSTLVKKGADKTLTPFLGSLTNSLLKVALIISLAGMVGIKTTSFVAILGAAGLAIGLALRDSLSNFAGGVIILIFRPFKVGDLVESGSITGTVKEIQIFSTILTTGDNKTIVLPNSILANGAIINYTTQLNRRVDIVFGISYEDDFEVAKSLISDFISIDERVLKDPAPFVRVSALGASSVDITLRAWVKKEDYWAVYHDSLEGIKKEFDKSGISFPYPQSEISFKTSIPHS